MAYESFKLISDIGEDIKRSLRKKDGTPVARLRPQWHIELERPFFVALCGTQHFPQSKVKRPLCIKGKEIFQTLESKKEKQKTFITFQSIHLVNIKAKITMKKSKDLSLNPRPLNSFMLFKKSIKNEIMKNYAVQSSSDVSSIAGQIWKSMTSEDKQPFLDEYVAQLSIWTEKETMRLEKELKAGSPTATVKLAILCKKTKVAKKTNAFNNQSSPVKSRRYSDSSVFSSYSDGSFSSPEPSQFSPSAPLEPSAFMKELDELIASSGKTSELNLPTLTSLSSTIGNESSTDSMMSSTVYSDIDSSQDPSFFFSDCLDIKPHHQPVNYNSPFVSFQDLLDQSTLFTPQQPSLYPSFSLQNYDYMNTWIHPGLETKVDDKRLNTILEEEKQSLPCFATFCNTLDEVL